MSISLAKPTAADIPRLVLLEEQAAQASTGTGFTWEDHDKHALLYSDAIKNETQYLVRLIKDETGAPVGSMLVDFAHRAAIIEKVLGEPFVEGGHGTPVSAQTVLDSTQNKVEGQKRAHLISVALSLTARGKGVGKDALAQMLELLRSMGCDVLTFSTGTHNIALRRLIRGATLLEVQGTKDGYHGPKLIGLLPLK